MTEMSEIQVLITLPFSASRVERLRSLSPRLQIHVHPTETGEDLPDDLLRDINVLYTMRFLPDPEAVSELKWIQFHLAGIDHVVDHPLLRSDIKITTLSGAAVPQMAEFALMSILALGHRLPAMMADSEKKQWVDERFKRYSPTELRGSVVGIIGYGSVGREVARICRAFGAQVLATKRDLKHLDDAGYSLDGLGDPAAELPDRLYPPEALRSMVSLCDFIVVAVPLTPETRGMVDERVFQKMKPTAYLIDISRGGVIDHGALVEVLKEKKLAGAAMDVYPIEPLPESSPLWEMPNVILSPHVAGGSKSYTERAIDMFAENLQRFLTDRPLLNVFDPNRGY